MEVHPKADIADKPLQNDCLLKALALQPTPYTPVWLMRQAGRYLPEYNATRAKAGSFLKLAKTPDTDDLLSLARALGDHGRAAIRVASDLLRADAAPPES